jgi:hypothetical protein
MGWFERRSPRIGLALVLALTLILLVIMAWFMSPNARLVTTGIAVFAVLLAAVVLVLPARLVARDTNDTALEGEQRANCSRASSRHQIGRWELWFSNVHRFYFQ